jgi:hypothetical protein
MSEPPAFLSEDSMNESFLGPGRKPRVARIQSPLKAARTYLQVVSTHQSPDNDGVERNARGGYSSPAYPWRLAHPKQLICLKDIWAEGENS